MNRKCPASSGDPTDRVSAINRISIRAVVVADGEDPSAALAEAGIVDAVAVPIMIGDEPDQSGGLFGDGRTPNLIAVLETVQADEDALYDRSGAKPASTGAAADTPPASTPTSMLPAAYGMQPLAPVRKTDRPG